jgi:hypothetical protein
MADFGSLWIGNPLSKIEQTALSSLVYHGHSITLFVYNMDLEVPKGVIKSNANILIPEYEIFKVQNSYGPFADIFRYKMIKQTGLIWTDTDSICLKSNWNFGEYIFGYEEEGRLSNSILGMPQDSELIDFLINNANKYDKTKIVWSEIGPQLLTKGVKRFKLFEHVQEPKIFYPIHFWQWKKLWLKDYAKEVISTCEGAYTLQVWNQFLNREGIDKNKLPKGSAIEYYYNKFVID